jgi:hypothetical protein
MVLVGQHLDLTASNILFCLLPHVVKWSDVEVYTYLGGPENPRVEAARTHDRQSPSHTIHV